MADVIRILVVDDHAIIRDGIKLIIETVDEIEVVGEAENGRIALEQVAILDPDVVLMDLRMPEMDGLTAIKHMRADYPQISIIILTTYNEDQLMLQGLQLGAHSYLLKDVDRQTLFRTIKAGAGGEILLQPEILQRIMREQASSNAPHHHTGSGDPVKDPAAPEIVDTNLTGREIEVIRRVAAGERNKEIAYHLAISESTVKAHLSHIFTKLDVDSRAGAVAVAAQHGLLPSKKR